MKPLRYTTPDTWTTTVLADFDAFLRDHAAAEKKASGMAISLLTHYPDRNALVSAMAELAVEEMTHFREVVRIIQDRGGHLGPDVKDPYVLEFRRYLRQGREVSFLDRLLTAAIIEARGAERFGLIAEALPAGHLKSFYKAITRSEERHYALFLDLAGEYFAPDIITPRLDELLDIEARICAALPLQAVLH